MKCRIEINPKTRMVSEVLAPNGLPSLAFSKLDKIYGETKALDIYKRINSEEFLSWFGDNGHVDSNGEPNIFKGLIDGENVVYFERYNGDKIIADEVKGNFISDIINNLTDGRVIENPNKSGYITKDGVEVSKRITQITKNYNKKRSGQSQHDRMMPIYADKGTVIHSYFQHLTNAIHQGIEVNQKTIQNLVKTDLDNKMDENGNYFLREYDSNELYNLSTKDFSSLAHVARVIYEEMKILGEERGGIAEVFTEITIHDPEQDVAGTIDNLFLFNDGSASIFDYKTMYNMLVWSDELEQYVAKKNIKHDKIEGYSRQIAKQMEILQKHYGISKFNETRIIPLHINLKYDKKTKEQTPIIYSMNVDYYTQDEVSDILKPIPVANEMTTDEATNKMLLQLREQRLDLVLRSMGKKGKIAGGEKTELEEEINRLYNTEKHILIDQQPDIIAFEAMGLIEFIQNKLTTTSELTPELARKIKRNMDALDFFETILKQSIDSTVLGLDVDDSKKNNAVALTQISNAKQILEDFFVLKVKDAYDRDLSITLKEKGFLDQFNTTSELEGEQFRFLDDVVQESYAKTNSVISDKIKFLEEFNKDLSRSELSIIEKLIRNENDGNLVNKWSKEYHEAVELAYSNNDGNWFMNTHEIRDYDAWKEFYDAKLDEKWTSLQQRGLISKDDVVLDDSALIELEQFDNTYDIENSPSARLNQYNKFWLQPKNPTNWYSAEYIQVDNNPKAKELYSFIVGINTEARKFGINKTTLFTPSIRRGVMEQVFDGKFGLATKQIVDSFAEHALEDDQGNIYDPNAMTVPVYFQSEVFTKENIERLNELSNREDLTEEEKVELEELETASKVKLNVNEKSNDILSDMTHYLRTIYNYKHMSEIEPYLELAQSIVNNKDQYTLDQNGRLQTDEYGDLVRGRGNDNNRELFKFQLNYHLYGKSISSNDKKIDIGGKRISMIKSALLVKRATSAMTLGFNDMSMIGNGANAMLTAFMHGAGGQYYSNKQLKKALHLFGTEPRKAGAIVKLFNILDEKQELEAAKSLTRSKLKSVFDEENFYVFIKMAEKIPGNTTILAIMDNYGVDPNTGKIRKVELLRKLHGDDFKSILDSVEVTENDIVIPGITDNPKEFQRLRAIARANSNRIRGASSQEDVHALGGTILGQLITQYRSWIIPTVKTRFKEMGYDNLTNELVIGRYRAFGGDIKNLILNDGAHGAIQGITKLLTEFGVGWISKSLRGNFTSGKGVDSAYRSMYNEWKKKNKHLPNIQKLQEGSKEDDELFEEFKLTRRREFNSALSEFRMIAVALLAASLAKGDWDDDGEPDYKNWFLSRKGVKYLDRIVTELTFFTDPRSADEFISNPIPIMSVVTQFYNLAGNTFDVGRDAILGQNKSGDITGMFYYGSRLIPGVRPVLNLWDDWYYSDDNSRKTLKEGERGFQFYKTVID